MTRTLALTPLALFACLTLVHAQAQPPAEGPRLVLQNKALEFEELVHGQVLDLQVPLENAGTAPLEIRQVKPSCGCTVARFPEVIAPGKTGTLALRFNSAERPAGYQSFRIAVYSNDPTQTDLGAYCTVLTLRGDVRTLFRLAPHGAYFGEFVRGTGAQTKSLVVSGIAPESRDGFELRLDDPELPDYLRARVVPLPAAERRQGVRLEVELLPHAPLGPLERHIRFATSVAAQPLITVLVTALVNQRVTAPTAVQLGVVPRGTGLERLIPVERRDGKDGIPIAKLHYDQRLLEIKTQPVSARQTQLRVRVRPDAPPGPFATLVHVFLDDPDQKLVSVPLYGRIEPRVRFKPALLLLPTFSKGNEVVGVVEVQLPADQFVSARVEPAEAAGLTTTVTPDSERGCVRVELRSTRPVPSDAWPREGALVLVTKVAGEEELRVSLVRR